jgi:hypothetical protein
MTRWSLGTLLATMLAGPWGGCEQGPVTPPASPPTERAPSQLIDPADSGLIVIDSAHRRG